MISAVRRDSAAGTTARAIGGLVGLSIPSFWLATLLLLFTSRVFGWVPPLVYISPFEDPIGNLSQFILPAISISVFTMAIVMRMVRATMLEVLGQDYVRTARAKGVGRRTVISKHALRNALIPVVTIVGFEIGVLIGGAAIIETIFGLPGVGYVAPAGDLRPRLPRHPGDDAADRVHLHLRQPARGHPLRRPRPEDLPGMSRSRRPEPAFATDGGGDAPTAWEAMPRRRLAFLGKWRNPIGLVGAGIVVFNVLVALFGPVRLDGSTRTSWSRLRFEDPSWAHPMGTDELGRDTLARIIHGAQVSLQVGAISVSIAFVGGVVFGMLAGYYKGILDTVLMRLVDIMFSLPGIVLAIVIAGLLGPNRRNAMIAIGIVILPAFARVVRGAVLEVMGYPYTESSRALGASGLRIMLRHVIPNIGAPLLVLVTVYLSVAILAEAALSFLGLGTQPPEASWGSMLSTGANVHRHPRRGCRSSRAPRS